MFIIIFWFHASYNHSLSGHRTFLHSLLIWKPNGILLYRFTVIYETSFLLKEFYILFNLGLLLKRMQWLQWYIIHFILVQILMNKFQEVNLLGQRVYVFTTYIAIIHLFSRGVHWLILPQYIRTILYPC